MPPFLLWFRTESWMEGLTQSVGFDTPWIGENTKNYVHLLRGGGGGGGGCTESRAPSTNLPENSCQSPGSLLLRKQSLHVIPPDRSRGRNQIVVFSYTISCLQATLRTFKSKKVGQK